MLEVVLISIVLIGCLSTCWAIFHVRKKKKSSKKEIKKEEPKTESTDAEKESEITEDIQLSKGKKLKVVKSAVLVPKIERVYAKQEEEKREEEKPVVVLSESKSKPTKIVTSNAARSIERVFSGKKEEEEVKEKPLQDKPYIPNRTPSIADRIEFREHLAEIYGGFKAGAQKAENPASEIEKIQAEAEDDEEESSVFRNVSGSSIFASMFNQSEPQKEETNIKNVKLKDLVLADVIMNRPKLSKNLKKNSKK